MSLASNALTTLDAVRVELKLFSVLTVNNETLTDSGNHKKYYFINKAVIQSSITRITETITETIGTTINDVTSSATIDYTNGTATFAAARTGTIKAVQYDYLKYNTSNDILLERKINAYSEWIEKACGRKFSNQNYVEKYAGSNRQMLVLNQFPVTEINSIKVNGDTLDESDYEATDNDLIRGSVYRQLGWTWEGYLVGLVGEELAPIRSIEVDYDAGYILPNDATTEDPRTLPYDLEELILQLIALDYNQYGAKGLESFSISDVKWKWDSKLKDQYNAILDRYMLRRV